MYMETYMSAKLISLKKNQNENGFVQHIFVETYAALTAWWNLLFQTLTDVETKSHTFFSLSDYKNVFKQAKFNSQTV